jgi:hypothetical protein
MQLHLDEIEGGKQIASIKAVHSRNIAVRPDVNAEITLISPLNRIVAPSVAPSSSAAHLGRRRSRL